MIKLYDNGVYLLNGTDIVEDNGQAEAQIQAKCGAGLRGNDCIFYFEST